MSKYNLTIEDLQRLSSTFFNDTYQLMDAFYRMRNAYGEILEYFSDSELLSYYKRLNEIEKILKDELIIIFEKANDRTRLMIDLLEEPCPSSRPVNPDEAVWHDV